MKSFSERNQLVIGVVGLALTIGIVLGSLNYDRLPFLQGKEYSAYFAEAGGLTTGAGRAGFGLPGGRVSSPSSWTARGRW